MEPSIFFRRPVTESLGILARLPLAGRFPRLSWYRPVNMKKWALGNASGHVKSIRGAYRAQYPIPVNLGSRDQLPGLVRPWVRGYSFRDVPDLEVDESFTVEIDDCWIVRTRYEWGEGEFCICNPQGQPLRFHGLVSDEGNTEMRRTFYRALEGECEALDQATWTVGHWCGNHYHWFAEWLPRIVLALELGLPAENILLPSSLSRAAFGSLALLNISPRWLQAECDAWRVGRLTVVSESVHHGPAHNAVTRRLCAGMGGAEGGSNKLWISRRKAVNRRNLSQEAEIEAWIFNRGWRIVHMETLSLAEQINMMKSARAIAGVHGAGLTNILFAPPGTPILEIVVRERPCPEYFALASCLGHPYWYVEGTAAGNHQSLLNADVVVSIGQLQRAVIDIERFLERQTVELG